MTDPIDPEIPADDEVFANFGGSTDAVHGRPGIRIGTPRRRRGSPAKRTRPPVQTVVRRDEPRNASRWLSDLADFGRSVAAAAGFPSVTEFAAGSESTYLHVQRENTWFGVRLSMHDAAYACSHDYRQLKQPRDWNAALFEQARRDIRLAVAEGGLVVADPMEVRRCLWLQSVRMMHGHRVDQGGIVWQFSASDFSWRLEREHNGDADCGIANEADQNATSFRIDGVDDCGDDDPTSRKPTWIPRGHLSTAQTASIRHRCNWREKWSASQRGIPTELLYA